MVRPKEGHQLRVVSHQVDVSPTASVRRAQDVNGNTVARALFTEPSHFLRIDAHSLVDLDSEPWPVFDIDASAISYPFVYSEQDLVDLAPLMAQQYPDPDNRLGNWANGFVRSRPTDTLSMLKDLSAGILNDIAYEAREAERTQAPVETLALRRGSCRDLAVLLAEAVRNLGFASRVVSGYRYSEEQETSGFDNGATHAWTEIYLPGAGWVTFDPTNRSLGNYNLVPVAVARDIRQLVPVSGSFAGPADALEDMTIEVHLKPVHLPAA